MTGVRTVPYPKNVAASEVAIEIDIHRSHMGAVELKKKKIVFQSLKRLEFATHFITVL